MRWRRRAITCRRAVDLVTTYLEGGLSGADARRYEAHLRGCPDCTAYLEQMRATIATLGHLDERVLPDAVRDELVLAYLRWRRV
jgi:anti-sigma factor RsiW